MNSPYMGRFQITQAFTSEHDGLDLVGLDSKQIHSTVNGTVIHAGWENPSNHSQGFGLYVCIRVGNQDYYYGHMSQIYVSVGQTVKITDIIGLEGSTGYSTGSHCHYCCRVAGTMTPLDINAIPETLSEMLSFKSAYVDHEIIERFVSRIKVIGYDKYKWIINLSGKEFDEARAWRKLSGDYVRNRQWNDIEVDIRII